MNGWYDHSTITIIFTVQTKSNKKEIDGEWPAFDQNDNCILVKLTKLLLFTLVLQKIETTITKDDRQEFLVMVFTITKLS